MKKALPLFLSLSACGTLGDIEQTQSFEAGVDCGINPVIEQVRPQLEAVLGEEEVEEDLLAELTMEHDEFDFEMEDNRTDNIDIYVLDGWNLELWRQGFAIMTRIITLRFMALFVTMARL